MGNINEEVKIESGLIHGRRMDNAPNLTGTNTEEAKDVLGYLAVPYAAPPLGDLRWQDPRPVAPWLGIMQCTDFGASAIPNDIQRLDRRAKASEDCLTVNVWTPAVRTSDKLPVLVYFHGLEAPVNNSRYDGTKLAHFNHVIVVTFEFRTGIFGYFAHPSLSQESEHCVSGNYGMLDQIAALQWIQRNIETFGGDPSCVTVFGHSFGGGSVLRLLSSALAKRLFKRAVVLSSGDPSVLKGTSMAALEERGRRITSDICNSESNGIRAMRGMRPADVLKAAGSGGGMGWGPNIDGWCLTGSPFDVLKEGKQNDIPVIIGNHGHDREAPENENFSSIGEYRDFIFRRFGNEADRILSMFPLHDCNNVMLAVSRVATVFIYQLMARVAAESISAKSNSYVYEWNRIPPAWGGFGVVHGSIVPYIFGTKFVFESIRRRGGGDPLYDTKDLEISNIWRQMLVAFARTGNPSENGLVQWPAYSILDRRYLDIGEQLEVKKVDTELIDLYYRFIADNKVTWR